MKRSKVCREGEINEILNSRKRNSSQKEREFSLSLLTASISLVHPFQTLYLEEYMINSVDAEREGKKSNLWSCSTRRIEIPRNIRSAT